MGLLYLCDNIFYKELLKRKTPNSITYAGILQPISKDTNELLEYIKKIFPEYPAHNIQHSFRILSYLSKMVSQDFLKAMTDTELFCLIMTALFHDTGMAIYNTDDKNSLRDKHHEFSTIVLDRYFEEKLSLLSYRERLKIAISFACKSHGMNIQELYGSSEYSKRDSIASDTVRFSVLSSLIRIGDLMDLDSDRVNEFVLSQFASDFSDISKAHNERHLKVNTYFYDTHNLVIEVFAENIEQYKIWSTWFEYINNEILHINSYLSSQGLYFPVPNTKIVKDPNANFEVEEIRFEIDESGGIWKILSQSIYTDELDFLRELVQNAIDATLMKQYSDRKFDIKHISPRSWETSKHCSDIMIGYSEKRKELFIIDSGIGMNQSDLKRFLFKMTGSGYSNCEHRDFPFPSIAKFGIGFASCLINANNIEIFTKKQEEQQTHHVTLTADNNLAITQNINGQTSSGTIIRLKLRQEIPYSKIRNYLTSTFVYPSVGILCFNVDDLENDSIIIDPEFCFDELINSSFLLREHFYSTDSQKKEIDSPYSEKEQYYKTLQNMTDELSQWIHEYSDFDDKYSDQQKFIDFKDKVREINQFIRQSKYNQIVNFPLNLRNISEKVLFTDVYIYLDKLNNFHHKINDLIKENNLTRPKFSDSSCKISFEPVSWGMSWKYCVIDLDVDFNITNIEYSIEAIDLSKRTGILLLNHEFKDSDDGIEYAAINGFLFHNGDVCSTLTKLTGHYKSYFSNTETQKEYIAAYQNDSLDFFDDPELVENIYYDDLLDEETVPDPFTLEDLYSLVLYRNNSFTFIDQISKNELNDISQNSRTIQNSELFQAHLTNRVHHSLTHNKNYPTSIVDIDIIESSDNFVFCQDGIRFNNDLWGIFPLGIFKFRCNLTASSRLPLNVTRHKFSEISSEIEPWIKTTGQILQKTILSSVKQLLSEASLSLYIREFEPTNYSNNILSKKLNDLFPNII